MAEAYHRPFAPHDCTGPVVYTAGTHFCLATPNAMIQEGVRAYRKESDLVGQSLPAVIIRLEVIENIECCRPPA